MARPIAISVLVAAIVVSGAFVNRVPAQQPAPAQTELLAEVRLLRQAIESLAGTNARVQIVFGRLQLQDQRTEIAARRLDVARDALAALNKRVVEAAEQIKASEAAIASTRLKPEDVETLQDQTRYHRRQLERLEAERAQLIATESDAAAILNQEQGRWSELNRQLEELERLLTTKP